MTKKGPGTRDHRSEPDSEATGQNYRVDRVFAPARPAPRPTPSSLPPSTQRPSGAIPSPMPAATQPPPTVSRTETDTELSLRRQLSRLQFQLAEAQRELATKDEELAVSAEKRLEIQRAYEVLLDEQRETQMRLAEADDYRVRMGGVEQRLQDAIAVADELKHQLERERTERATMAVQFDEANAAFERARNMWREETALAGEHTAAQLGQLEQQKRIAIEAAEAAMNATLERQKEAHQAELDALREAHERSVGALRGEVEPHLAQARNLAEEIARLESEIEAQRTEHVTLLEERIELHKWEMQQLIEQHQAELAARARIQANELSRMSDEVAAANEAGQMIERNSKLREQLWEQTVTALREREKKMQQEIAELREKAAQADAQKWSVEQRLVTMLQTAEKHDVVVRDLREQLEVAQTDAKRNELERQRFAAYLEEGLAMLGAVPARAAVSAGDPPPAEAMADEAAADAPAPDAFDDEPPTAHTRTTRPFQIEDLEPEIEAEALPEPTRPGPA